MFSLNLLFELPGRLHFPSLYTSHPTRIKTGMAAWTYQDNFTLFFCLSYKRGMKTIFVSTFRTDMEFLFYCYLLRFLTHQLLLPLDRTPHAGNLFPRALAGGGDLDHGFKQIPRRPGDRFFTGFV